VTEASVPYSTVDDNQMASDDTLTESDEYADAAAAADDDDDDNDEEEEEEEESTSDTDSESSENPSFNTVCLPFFCKCFFTCDSY